MLCWSCDLDRLINFLLPQALKALYKIWLPLAKWLLRRGLKYRSMKTKEGISSLLYKHPHVLIQLTVYINICIKIFCKFHELLLRCFKKKISCSTQLSMKIFLLINVKMLTIVGTLTFMSRKNSILSLYKSDKS